MKKQLAIGMPASGKSTYIGALRHLLVHKDVELELETDRLSTQEQHINALESQWLACEQMDRTRGATEAWVEIIVRDRVTGEETTLSIPDLRGELFVRPAARGRFPRELHEAASEAAGVMLFTNTDRADDAIRIEDIEDILPKEGPAKESEPREESVPLLEPVSFRPEDMPEEVMIVEFLQMVNRRPLIAQHRKLALIASAWDVVAENTEPHEWLERERPMLAQFLRHNKDLWDTRVYGISAQGGRLPADAAALQAIETPSHRVKVVGHGAGQHDLTAPLRWLIAPGS